MNRPSGRRGPAFLFLVAGLAGCVNPPPPRPQTDTGAGHAARTFFEAILREDWSAAHDALDPESRAWCPRTQFDQLGRRYRALIGFPPTDVTVAVTETADRASAVAAYRGTTGTEPRSYKDGAALRRTPAGWAVVLRKNFGNQAPAAIKHGKSQ